VTSGCSARAPVASVSEASEATAEYKNMLPVLVLIYILQWYLNFSSSQSFFRLW